MKKATKQEKADAIEALGKEFQPGDTVWTVLRRVSASGMSRIIGVRSIRDGEARWLSRLVAKATGHTFDEKTEELRVSGCGMDMGYHVAYNLSSVLHPDGFGCIGERCPSNDHSNGDRNRTPHGQNTGQSKLLPSGFYELILAEHWHKDGGYALRHRWI